MSSTLKVDILQDSGGNNIISSNGSGDLTIPTGKLSGQNYPAFEAYLNGNIVIDEAVDVKISVDSEVYDTNGYYDNTTNYRFTPLVAGKYYVYGNVQFYSGGASRIEQAWSFIYKNGNRHFTSINDYRDNNIRIGITPVSGVVDMNGSTDYLELYAYLEISAGTRNVLGATGTYTRTAFGAFRIGD